MSRNYSRHFKQVFNAGDGKISSQIRGGVNPEINYIKKSLPYLGLERCREEVVFSSEKNLPNASMFPGGAGCRSRWGVATMEGRTAIIAEDATLKREKGEIP